MGLLTFLLLGMRHIAGAGQRINGPADSFPRKCSNNLLLKEMQGGCELLFCDPTRAELMDNLERAQGCAPAMCRKLGL